MPAGSNSRSLARVLATADVAIWIIGSDRRLSYVSAAAAQWFGVDADELIQRQSSSGTPASDDPLDVLAASLSPPPGLTKSGALSMQIQPHGVVEAERREVLFVRIGDGDTSIVMAVTGQYDLAGVDAVESVIIRQQLDAWRRRHMALAVTVTAGTSVAAKRLRAWLAVAAKIRCHLGFFGPAGCGAEALATRVHALSAPDEPLVVVDGPLMDSELLEATIAPAIHQLAESNVALASVLVRSVDEMPIDAQSRLAEVIVSAGGRLRLFGLCSSRPQLFRQPIDDANENDLASPLNELNGELKRVIEPRLAECLSLLHVYVEPLKDRVEDLPLLAAAILDARHAAKEGPAERLSRGALDAIVAYPWPGNYNELDAAIRHAIRTSVGDTISPEQLPLAVRSYRSSESAKPEPMPIALDAAVSRYEWRLIQDALVASGDNRAEAARRLGISRARLLRKIDEAASKSLS